jgi:hypothetical protein
LLAALPQSDCNLFLEDTIFYRVIRVCRKPYLDKTQDKLIQSLSIILPQGSRILFENISIKSGGVYALGKTILISSNCFIISKSKLCYLNVETKEFATITFGFGSKELDYKFYFLLGKYYLVHTKNQ